MKMSGLAWTLVLVLVLATSGWAAETNLVTFTDKTGRVWKNAKVLRVEADAITVASGGAAARIKLRDMPAEMQQRFGYDEAKAEAATQAAEAKIKSAEKQAVQQRQAYLAKLKAERDFLDEKRAFWMKVRKYPGTVVQKAFTEIHVASSQDLGKSAWARIVVTDQPNLIVDQGVILYVFDAVPYTYTSIVGKEIQSYKVKSVIPEKYQDARLMNFSLSPALVEKVLGKLGTAKK